MSTPTAPAGNNVTTPGSHASPTPVQHQSPQVQISHHQRKEVAVIFVVDGTARMKPHFKTLYEAYVEPILKQLRSPSVVEGEDGQTKTKITPVLKYGLVVFGDYEPLSVATVDRKYFTSDPILFQDIFSSIVCENGGIINNAVEEGMVAALELFDEYREELEGREVVQHCILLSNSLPYKIGARCNLAEKYDGLDLSDIANEMKKSNIKLSLIAPQGNSKDLEEIVTQVNDQKTELNTVTKTILPTHLVILAGFKLPVVVAPPPQPPQPTTEMNNNNTRQAIVGSPQSTTSDNSKKRKRENVPGQISLPKPSFDGKSFAESNNLVKKHVKKEEQAEAETNTAEAPVVVDQPVINTPPAKLSPVTQTVQQQPQMGVLQQVQMQPQPIPPQPQQQPSPQIPLQQQLQQIQLQQMQQLQQQQQQQQQQPQARPPQISQAMARTMQQNPLQFQQYLLQQRNNLIAQGANMTPQQQAQLQSIQAALLKLGDQLRRASNGNQQPATATPNASSPMPFAATVANPGGLQVRPEINNANNNLMQNPLQQQPLNLSNIPANLTPQQRMLIAAQLAQRAQQQQQQQSSQQQSSQQQGGIRPPANINDLQAQLLQSQSQQQPQSQSQQPQQQQQPQPQPQQQPQPPQPQQPQPQPQQQPQQTTEQQTAQQQASQQQQQTQPMPEQQQPGGMPTHPIWTGQIVWHIKTPEGQLQEFSCHCGAFAITLKGINVSLDEYRPDIWPSRIQIAGRSPLARAQFLQRQAIDNKLPFCQFRPLSTSSQQDQTNFALLVRNLEQKKYIATVVFNLGASQGTEPHGVVLTHTTGKLIGIVFTRVPLPDLNANNGATMLPTSMPQQAQNSIPPTGPNAPVSTNTNINPAMLANLQNTANMVLLNATNNTNVQHLQNALRQQQLMNMANSPSNQQQPQQQPQNQGQQPQQTMNGLNPNSLLLSNINLGGNNPAVMNALNANNLLNMNNINMASLANLSNLQPNAVRDLQQRIFLARQQQQQQQQQQNGQHPPGMQ